MFVIILAAMYVKLDLPDFMNRKFKFLPYILSPIILAIIGSLLLLVLISIDSFHKKYYLPENSKNIAYMINKYCISSGNANRDSVKVLYMNDKYIFIKDSSRIEVVKFDYMFRDK